MTLICLLFSCGIISAAYLPSLPSLLYLNCFLAVISLPGIFLFKKFPRILWGLAFAFGVAYGIFSGHRFVENQLPVELVAEDLIVEGQVIDLPEVDGHRQLFEFRVNRAYAMRDSSISYKHFPGKINLSSYDDLRVKTGEQWRLCVKLKQPRGFVNPDGFDYQVSLLRRGIGATGYIRSNNFNQLIQQQPKFSMDVLRYTLQQWLLQKSQSPEKGILVALLVGDTSQVDKSHWGEMLKTGTNHLIAISGLHLGFFAIVGFFVGNFLGRFLQIFWHKCPAMVIGYFLAVFCAVFYSIIAGLNIPTLRTLIMLGVVQWAYLWRNTFRVRDTLMLALVIVLLYDPLASFDFGFWLSFGAVAMLIFCFSGRLKSPHKSSSRIPFFSYFVEFVKSQWVMFIGLLVPLSILVHTSSLLAPPANFVAIPLVTFFVVPSLILSALCHFTFAEAEDFFLRCAEWGLSLLHQWLQFLIIMGEGKFNPLVNFNFWAIALAATSVFIMLLPRGLGNKYLGCCGLILSLLIPLKNSPALQMLVFDVGQGTAALLRTPHHQMLYDTGPVYTENFDAGTALIVPYLQSQGLAELDNIVVSHNDSDHSGGLPGILASTKVDRLLLGEPEKYHRVTSAQAVSDPSITYCHEAPSWEWDGVKFRFITWPVDAAAKANNHSCVLLVEYEGHKIMLTGDIEKDVEHRLIANDSLMPVDVLFAPHHGSHTSSTTEFVAQTQPQYVIYSAGYHNQHGHPHRDVQDRYRAINAHPFNTAFSGALEFNWNDGKLQLPGEYRKLQKRYWFSDELENTPTLQNQTQAENNAL